MEDKVEEGKPLSMTEIYKLQTKMVVRTCAICQRGTEDLDHVVCPECRAKLQVLLYGRKL